VALLKGLLLVLRNTFLHVKDIPLHAAERLISKKPFAKCDWLFCFIIAFLID